MREVKPDTRPIPFSLTVVDNRQSIGFRTSSEMTQRDRDLVANAESSISERAGFMGMEFNGGKWSYEQAVCPALPNHVLLRFSRDNGTGDMSMFSASIPRNGDGRVRIIPIRMRGYSLFSPAPINALTISAFNHIRAEEHTDAPPEWIGTALCYAALAGGHPHLEPLTAASEAEKPHVALPAKLAVTTHGTEVVSFADVSATPNPMEWTMIFDSKGKLLKATHKPAVLIQGKVNHPVPVVMNGNVIPPT